jgi:hypothetical protein
MSSHDMRDDLLAALGDREDEGLAASMARASLMAAFEGDPVASQVFEEWRLGAGVSVDLHLTGDRVEENATRADHFGRLIARMGVAVKELAKDASGRLRHVPGLLVAPEAPASVRVALRTRDYGRAEAWETLPTGESLDSWALRTLTSLMIQADEQSEALDASVLNLRGGTRHAVGMVAKAVIEGGWDVSGSLTAGGRETVPIHFDPQAAKRLVEATSQEQSATRPIVLSGVVDGWIWSQSVMPFDPDTGSRFVAAVPRELQARVGEINAGENRRVVAGFEVTDVYARGDRSSSRPSYLLQTIQLMAPDDEPLPFSQA